MKLMAIDGNSLINRAYYGVRSALTSQSGVPTNAVYGFFMMLMKLRDDYSPDAVCICFDRREPTVRHRMYDGYKATRKPMPEDLAAQMPIIRQALELMGLRCLDCPGYEADDILGTLAAACAAGGDSCVIVTGDRDSLQFVSSATTVGIIITKQGQTTTQDYDPAMFAEQYCGLTPDKMVDLKAIMGDSSDNIPGVRGIGEKGALDLLCRFSSLDGVYAAIDDPSVSASTRKKLEDGKDSAYLSYTLAKGITDAPVDVSPASLAPLPMREGELYALFDGLQLRTLIKRLDLKPPQGAGNVGFTPRAAEHIRTAEALAAADPAALPCCAAVFSDAFDCCAVTAGDKSWAFSAVDVGESAFAAFARRLLARADVTLCDAKPVFAHMLSLGEKPPLPAFDVALAGYLLNPSDGDYTLPALAQKYLGHMPAAAIYNAEDSVNLFGVTDDALNALAEHSQIVAALRGVMAEQLSLRGMASLLTDMELPLMAVLASMEHAGMAVDSAGLTAFGTRLAAQIDVLERKIYDLAGETFTIGSPKQLGAVLFEKLGLKSTKKTKTGYSTDADVLDKLASKHEIVADVLEWRRLSKLKSTYTDGLVKMIRHDGRIHTTFNQMVTSTGRLSSTEPNLQNIPIRQKIGSEIRRSFIAPGGFLLVDADYSQIELRILAHIAGDKIMLDAFAAGEDIHTVTASQVFGVPPDLVTSQMRSRAKAVNFGIVYGISAFSLSEDIGVAPKEAQSYIDAYFEKYTGVRRYMDSIRARAHQDGYVSTLYGRRRYLPELKSSNFNVRSFGERVALNAPIQGTAADIIKLAMINVCRSLESEGMKSRLILQVHDELILECPGGERERAADILRREMENAAKLDVRLAVDVSWGESWYDAKH